MKKHLLVACVLGLTTVGATAQNQIQLPYNPDQNADGSIGLADLQGVLSQYNLNYTPNGIMVDSMPLVTWVMWQDSLWGSMILELEEALLDLQDAVISGCTDPEACNYNPQASESDGICTFGNTWYADLDGDGLGSHENELIACTQPTGYVSNAEDGCDNPLAINFGEETNEPCVFAACEPIEHQGHTYEVTAIGTQCWFAENLQTRTFANGDSIPSTIGATGNPGNNWSAIMDGPAMTAYDMEEPNLLALGGLYNGHAIQDERKLCPAGWHVSTDLDWSLMEIHLGMSEFDAYAPGWNRGLGTDVNPSLRDESFVNGTNTTGFSALPAGVVSQTGYSGLGNVARFMHPDTLGTQSWHRLFIGSYADNRIERNLAPMNVGGSVRCVQD